MKDKGKQSQGKEQNQNSPTNPIDRKKGSPTTNNESHSPPKEMAPLEIKRKSFKSDPSGPMSPKDKPAAPQESNFVQRLKWTLIMIPSFLFVVYMGHFYVTLLIILLLCACYREAIMAIRKDNLMKNAGIDYNLYLAWYEFAVFMFYALSKTIASVTSYEMVIERYLRPEFTTFILWLAGLVIFVLTLRANFYRYQFKLFAGNIMTLLLMCSQLVLLLSNMYSGMIWFLLPTLLVICNDIFAYVFGKSFGKHQLIALSPKKTWEGFIGGFFSTVLLSVLIAYAVSSAPKSSESLQFFLCPQRNLAVTPFPTLKCQISDTFRMRNMTIPLYSRVFGEVYCSEFFIHSIILSIFASLIAPFGGFFASGLKRGLKIKDFSSTIPGHGGFLDRFDCQTLMGSFTFFYIRHIVKGGYNSMGSVLIYLLTLDLDDQKYIMEKIRENLLIKGALH